MLRDIITMSMSPRSSPKVLVPKNDGRRRFCVNYRLVNDVMSTEPTLMFIIAETIRNLGNWQIPMDDASKPTMAFSDVGLFEFGGVLFGLKNAPVTFERNMMEQFLVGYLRGLYTKTTSLCNSPEEHLQHLACI